jgi:hypothetical protein
MKYHIGQQLTAKLEAKENIVKGKKYTIKTIRGKYYIMDLDSLIDYEWEESGFEYFFGKKEIILNKNIRVL